MRKHHKACCSRWSGRSSSGFLPQYDLSSISFFLSPLRHALRCFVRRNSRQLRTFIERTPAGRADIFLAICSVARAACCCANRTSYHLSQLIHIVHTPAGPAMQKPPLLPKSLEPVVSARRRNRRRLPYSSSAGTSPRAPIPHTHTRATPREARAASPSGSGPARPRGRAGLWHRWRANPSGGNTRGAGPAAAPIPFSRGRPAPPPPESCGDRWRARAGLYLHCRCLPGATRRRCVPRGPST